MNPSTPHPHYYDASLKWLRARDVLAGEDAVKAAGVRYLPRLESQTQEEYAAYKQRALFFNATARTAEGYLGLIFRRPPFVKVPGDLRLGPPTEIKAKSFAQVQADADLKGNTLFAYAKEITYEVLAVGRVGTLVDFSNEQNRPSFTTYRAETILNWQTARVRGRELPTLIALQEWAPVPSEDPFVETGRPQIRVLKLVEILRAGVAL